MADARQSIIIKGFRKYSHSLGPESLQYIEDICSEYGFADDLNQIEIAVEHLAKEYSRQEDAVMKVSLPLLQRAYHNLQEKEDRIENEDADVLDPEDHLFFIDSYDMPGWHWSNERSTFEKASSAATISGSAESRVRAIRDRLNIIRQTILRNDHFSPSTLPSRDRERLLSLRSTKQLLGRAGDRFLLFGLLNYSKEGKLCLEDSDGKVELDLSQLDAPSEGLFTDGCFILAEGDYTEDETFKVIAIGHPPCERRETAQSIYGHIDFLGKGFSTPMEDVDLAERLRKEWSELMVHCLSDVWLDHPETFNALSKIFDTCTEARTIPRVFVLCGNFTSRGISQTSGKDIQSYHENFDRLADLISSYPAILQSTHFVFVPGPLDLTSNSILPQRPILSSFVSKFKSRVPKAHFMSNPCRIKFFHQEIVIFREDLMARMLRNLVGIKPDVDNDQLKRYLVQSIVDQSHLIPLARTIQPTLCEYDHALRLYPAPSTIILADKYEGYELTYEGCHVFNPGSFVGSSFGFYTYFPARGRSESSNAGLEFEE
ncbi:epsilon DNA polymerase [Rickenella mellea]|uniref:DNA polymerase epsilon subunit n=1 Tax=Rickenella mellea TaxID=50990 RepID=A0A4R5XH42_9AGAM|nr:epsilon DNA polymerase [Rickenella mellea]